MKALDGMERPHTYRRYTCIRDCKTIIQLFSIEAYLLYLSLLYDTLVAT